MEKLKDIIYNKNDILVALIILAVAGFVIFSKINVIMTYSPADYPGGTPPITNGEGSVAGVGEDGSGTQGMEGSGEQAGQAGAIDTVTTEGIAAAGGTSGNNSASGTKSNDGTGAGGQEIYPYSVYISPGQTVAEIGKIMVDLGLFSTTADFIKLVEDKGLSTKMQTGTFIIPQNASHDEVIKILTKPGL